MTQLNNFVSNASFIWIIATYRLKKPNNPLFSILFKKYHFFQTATKNI